MVVQCACGREFETPRGLKQHITKSSLSECKDNEIPNNSGDSELPDIESANPILNKDFIEFKQFICEEINNLKITSPLLPAKPPSISQPESRANYELMLIDALNARIDSLENIIKCQQETIKSLCNFRASNSPAPETPKLGISVPLSALKSPSQSPLNMSGFPSHSPSLPIADTPMPTASNNQLIITNHKSPINTTPTHKRPPTQSATTNPTPLPQTATTTAVAATLPSATAASAAVASSSGAPDKNSKKCIEIIGDSMLGGIWNWTRESHLVKVRSYGGATSLDMNDMMAITLRRNPEGIIIHSGANDFDHSIDTRKELENVIAKVREHNKSIKIAISGLCRREDKPELIPKIKDLNNRLKTLCHQQQVAFIDNKNFNHDCLAAKKLHPNSEGNRVLATNFKRCIRSFGLN